MKDIVLRVLGNDDYDEHPVLYKYRDWNNDFHKKILVEPSVYFSSPRCFEDSSDCRMQVHYDLLSDMEIFSYYLNESQKINRGFEYFQHVHWAFDWFKISSLRDPHKVHEIEIETTNEFNDRFGVLSLTSDPLNVKMWDKYSNHKRGFCVGYDSKELFNFLGGGSEVIYTDDLPIIQPFEEHLIQLYKKVFFKELKWNFEKEYRTHKFWPQRVSQSERSVKISSNCIKEVILGAEIVVDDKIEIEKLVRSNFPQAKLIETKFKGNEIESSVNEMG